MNKKLIDLATQAGFPVNAEGGAYSFLLRERCGFFGVNEVEFDSKIQKFAELLFQDFLEQWWVSPEKSEEIQKP